MFTRLAFTRALTGKFFYAIAYYMQHGMTQLGILFPKGADDHARFILPKEVERVLDHRGSTCTPPSISTGVKGEGWILVFHVLDIKGFVVEPVPAQPHLSPGSTQKSNECICHDFESKKGKDFFVQSTIYNMCCIK
jgi:hypothetical protein